MGLDLMPYTAPSFIAQGYNSLAGAVQDVFTRQEAARREAEQLQAQDAKNQIIIEHAAALPPRADGSRYVDPQTLLDYHNAPIKKRVQMAEGIAANIAFDTATRNQAMQQYTNTLQNFGRMADTRHVNALTDQLTNPPPLPPLAAARIPVQGTDRTVDVIGGGGMKTQVLPAITGPDGKPKLELTADEIEKGKQSGKIPLRQSNGSFVWANDPMVFATSKGKEDSLEQFGKDFKAAQDILANGFLDPKTQDAMGNQFVKRLQTLTGKPAQNAAVTTPNVVHVKSVAEAMALPSGTPFYDPSGKLRTRP